MRCDQCKFWDQTEFKAVDGDLNFGLCTRALPFWNASTWTEDGKRVLLPEFEGRKFFAQDGSDYHASVYTAPDFFCAEFLSEHGKGQQGAMEEEMDGWFDVEYNSTTRMTGPVKIKGTRTLEVMLPIEAIVVAVPYNFRAEKDGKVLEWRGVEGSYTPTHAYFRMRMMDAVEVDLPANGQIAGKERT